MRVGLVCAHADRPAPLTEPVPGPHHHVTRVAAELAALGHDVRLYERVDGTDRHQTATDPAGYQLERVPAATTPSNRLIAQVTAFGRWLADRWSTEWKPDVVHGHFWVGGVAAATAVRSTTIPMVQTFHSLAAQQQRQLGGAYTGPGERAVLERALSRAVDLAVAQSPDEVDELTRMGLARASVAIVPPGVDTAMFTPEGRTEPVSAARPRIVSVGLQAGHGQDDLIRALRLVGEVELVIVDGPAGGDLAGHPEARRLRELAQRAGVADRVRFVGGVTYEQMPGWYRSASVVACPARVAGPATVPLEAMACGAPVVGYAVGGIAESVVDQVTGRLVPAGDVRALGLGLRQMVTDGTQRFAFANAAVDRVRCRYTWDRTAAGLERTYERAVDRRRPAGVAAAEPTEPVDEPESEPESA